MNEDSDLNQFLVIINFTWRASSLYPSRMLGRSLQVLHSTIWFTVEAWTDVLCGHLVVPRHLNHCLVRMMGHLRRCAVSAGTFVSPLIYL